MPGEIQTGRLKLHEVEIWRHSHGPCYDAKDVGYVICAEMNSRLRNGGFYGR